MARETTKRGRAGPLRQRAGTPPVIDPKLPRMGDGDAPPLRVGRGMLYMPDEPKRDTGSRNRMAPMRRVQDPVEPRVPKRGYPDQQPPKPPRGTKNGSGRSKKAREGYVRIRVLVQDGTLAVAGAKFVEGPLVETDAVHPGLVCEMMLGSRRLAASWISDAGVWRSFPDPLGRPGLQGHHVTEVPSYEFAIRVPVKDLSMAALSKVRMTLYRWSGTGHAELRAGRSLKGQLKGVKTVAVLNGIKLSRMTKQAQAELRSALK